MNDYVIETKGLTKRFGEKTAVNKLDLKVERGEIYGFIGKNGAGKTTAMKLILNMLRPNEGEVYLFGKKNCESSLMKVGSLIEEPGLYGECSAYENLKRFSYLAHADEKDIPSLIELVGLKDAGNKKVRSYSLGMKQRLGIAVAMIGNPELLILDEPINGLDPQGIKDVRDLITRVNRERNVTFFISSHILSELQKIATTCGIISDGVLLDEIKTSDLEHFTEQNIEIVCKDYQLAEKVIEEKFMLRTVTGNGKLTVIDACDKACEINEALVTAGAGVSFITPVSEDFETYFIEKTGGGENA